MYMYMHEHLYVCIEMFHTNTHVYAHSCAHTRYTRMRTHTHTHMLTGMLKGNPHAACKHDTKKTKFSLQNAQFSYSIMTFLLQYL